MVEGFAAEMPRGQPIEQAKISRERGSKILDELAKVEASAQVVMVGGAWMLWHSQRTSTRDVDSARTLTSNLNSAIAKVAERHDLSNE